MIAILNGLSSMLTVLSVDRDEHSGLDSEVGERDETAARRLIGMTFAMTVGQREIDADSMKWTPILGPEAELEKGRSV